MKPSSAVAAPKHHQAVPVTDIPELSGWLAQSDVRAQLLAETGGGEAFVAAAMPTLQNCLIGAALAAPDSSIKTPLRQLIRQGHSHQAIARAFAVAWLHESPVAYLPKPSLTKSGWLLYGAPLLLLTAVLSPLLAEQFRLHPQLGMASIYAGSFFVIPLIPVVWLVMKLWRWLLRGADVLTHHGDAVVVSIPQAELALGGDIRLDQHDNMAVTQALSPPPPSDSDQPLTPGSLQMSEAQAPTLTIDGKDYRADQLPEAARVQVANVQACEQEIARLQMQLAITQTARGAYLNALRDAMQGISAPS